MAKIDKINCPDCGGDGEITTSHEFKHCKMCNGSGKVNPPKKKKPKDYYIGDTPSRSPRNKWYMGDD